MPSGHFELGRAAEAWPSYWPNVKPAHLLFGSLRVNRWPDGTGGVGDEGRSPRLRGARLCRWPALSWRLSAPAPCIHTQGLRRADGRDEEIQSGLEQLCSQLFPLRWVGHLLIDMGCVSCPHTRAHGVGLRDTGADLSALKFVAFWCFSGSGHRGREDQAPLALGCSEVASSILPLNLGSVSRCAKWTDPLSRRVWRCGVGGAAVSGGCSWPERVRGNRVACIYFL